MFVQRICLSIAKLAVLLTVAGTACGGDIPIGWFDPSNFGTDAPITLCFDLNVPNPPKAGVVIRLPPMPEVIQRSVILPFRTTKVDQNKEAYVTSGSFDGMTLVNFVNTAGVPTSVGIGLTPTPDDVTEGDFFRTDLPGVLYLMESGLKRRFVYKLDAGLTVSRDSTLNRLSVESADTVAVRLPVGAEVFESHKGAAVAIRNLSLKSGAVRHYKASSPTPSAGENVDIVYQLQPTKLQNVLFEYGLKLFGAFLVPLLGVVLLTSAEVKQRKHLRRLILWIGAFVETALLAALLWWAFKIQSVTGLGALLEIGVAVSGVLATAALALVKERATV
jgi:hypothetical protein